MYAIRSYYVASLNYDFNLKRIERYLTLAWQSGAIPVVVLTKSDLVEDYMEQVRAVEKIAAGVGVFAVSAKTGYGIELLSEYLKPHKTIRITSYNVCYTKLLRLKAGIPG